MKVFIDLVQSDESSLQKELAVARKRLNQLRIERSLGALKQTHHITEYRHYVAQILTALTTIKKLQK